MINPLFKNNLQAKRKTFKFTDSNTPNIVNNTFKDLILRKMSIVTNHKLPEANKTLY